MRQHIKTLLFTLLIMLCATANHAAVRITPPASEEGAEQVLVSPEDAESPAASSWAGRKWDKLKKRIERKRDKWEKRLARKKAKRGDGDEGGSLWGAFAFILGIAFLIGGIILGIAAFGNPLGGFFHLLAGLLVVAGIVMILYTVLRDTGA
ncbi:MAG: hypothetical protein J5I94_17400 [Phaeodactylibacter sp.]|nr:hypothetical protein [Phaeodactylibacter sp.]